MPLSFATPLRRWPVGLLIGLGLVVGAFAKLPEPDAVFFGNITHSGGTPLVAVFSGEIAVVARLNGAEIARTTLAIGTSSYVLKVPLDDGQAPRLTGTARGGEAVRVFLLNTTTGTSVEASESTATSGLAILPERGVVTAKNLSTTTSLSSSSPLMASYAKWKLDYISAGLDAKKDDSAADLDHDGVSNFSEFIAGTDPADAASTIGIRDLKMRNGVLSVRFGPIRLSRRYLLETSSSPVGPWTQLGLYRFSAAANETSVDVIHPQQPAAFFRVRVEVE